MYWIWIIFTSPNEYLLDRGLGLVAKGTDWILTDKHFLRQNSLGQLKG